MNYLFIAYILVSIVTITGSYYISYNSNKRIQGMVLSIGFLALSIYFGILWFTPTGQLITPGNNPGSWPPSIQMCPDYLTLFNLNGQPVCVDPIGVSRNASSLQKWTGTQTDPSYIFTLTDSQGTPLKTQALCDQCSSKGITWEGIWDGAVCHVNNTPPVPAKGK